MELLKSKEAAKLIGVSEGTLRSWRAYRKDGPPYHKFPSGVIRYERAKIEEWIKGEQGCQS